jgi:hypothetical protein
MSTTNNAMDLPNVHAPEAKELGVGEYRIASPMAEVIWELALKNPMWTFKGTTFNWVDKNTDIKIMVLTSFTINQSWEMLGSIQRSYNRRNGLNGVEIKNHRLETRDNNYKTTDAAKAIAKIKKTFRKPTLLFVKKSTAKIEW